MPLARVEGAPVLAPDIAAGDDADELAAGRSAAHGRVVERRRDEQRGVGFEVTGWHPATLPDGATKRRPGAASCGEPPRDRRLGRRGQWLRPASICSTSS